MISMMNMMGRGMMYGGDFNSMPDYMKQMMQSYYGGMRSFWGFAGFLDVATSILWIILLIAAIRWLWSKGGK